jgi:eukaryotic-like serine/threonine-protein kinase
MGPYEITGSLGAGGMGEVYRARDTRLEREVALKILPGDWAKDASRRQRFELEARAVAALNHPNIVAVYDVGAEGGVSFIVSELVDGEPLRGKKPGVRKCLDIGVQIARGLAAAHAAGIVHRDLKPENVLLTRDGRVKILDFGLAKVTAAKASGAAATETVTVHTEPGMVMGTVGYMSPEQVRGKDADPRSDIFSTGLILHELLTGQRAFRGDTSVEVMTAILKEDAPELPESVPAGVREIVAHCLEKDPANRFQSAQDLAFALAQSGTQSGPAVAPQAPARRVRRGLLAGIAAVALVASVLGGHYLWRAPAQPVWTGVMLGGPALSMAPRLSPDGRLLAFVAADSDGVLQVWITQPESGNRVMLTHRRELGLVTSCSWSPDGSLIYYDRWYDQAKGIFSVPALGGDEKLIVEDAGAPEALADGSLLVVRINSEHVYQLFRYRPDSGQFTPYPVVVAAGPEFYRAVPGGRDALVIGAKAGKGAEVERSAKLYDLNLTSGEMRVVGGDYRAQFGTVYVGLSATRDGKFAIVSNARGNTYRVDAIPLNGSRLAEPLLHLMNPITSLDTGPDGSIYIDQIDRQTEILRFSPGGGQVERMGATLANPEGLDYFTTLPDGRAVWVERTASRMRLILVEPGKDPTPLINTSEETAGPVTVVGGDRVAFLIGPEPRRSIGVASLTNGAIVQRLTFDQGEIAEMGASPDGKSLYCLAAGALWWVPLAGGAPKRLRSSDGFAVDGATRSLVVQLREPPLSRLIRIPLNGGAEQEIAGRFALGTNIDPGSVLNGKLVGPMAAPTWYWPAGIFDLATGKAFRIPVNYTTDFHRIRWSAEGKLMAAGADLRSAIWKFTPQGK